MVFVDEPVWPYRGMLMCHMMPEVGGEEELHKMAEALGLKRSWYQTKSTVPHYDICKTKRAAAIKLGAVACDRNKTVEIIRAHRAAKSALH